MIARHRVSALFLRHVYLYRRSLPRLMEIIYWPLVDILLWGFLSIYLIGLDQEMPTFVGFLLGALILWEMLFRAQQSVSLAFLEDVWTRNLLNIFVSPVSLNEYILSTMLLGMVKIAAAFLVMSLLALGLYAFNVFSLGLHLLPFILALMLFGWAVGIVTTAIILRYGQGAEALAWGIAFLLQPVSAVFYPVDVLPPLLQKVALFLPSARIFEGMRQVLSSGALPQAHLIWAMSLNLFYLALAVLFLHHIFAKVLDSGRLTRLE